MDFTPAKDITTFLLFESKLVEKLIKKYPGEITLIREKANRERLGLMWRVGESQDSAFQAIDFMVGACFNSCSTPNPLKGPHFLGYV